MSARENPSALIGMPTFKRPEGLSRIMPLLLDQVNRLTGATARIAVIDNDPDGGAREAMQEWLSAQVSYAHEPSPGIAAARNRALELAADDDLMICIDDDETPDEAWLQTLIDCWKQWGAAAVAGPVHTIPEVEMDPWVAASGQFDSRRAGHGAVVRGAGSGNLLLDVAQLRAHDLRFDEEFGLTGGSDTMLTYSITHLGMQVRWCATAECSEYVPENRLNRDWVIRRIRRTSNDYGRVNLALAGPAAHTRARAELAARGAYRYVKGASDFALGKVRRDVARQARGEVAMATGYGLVTSVRGRVESEYVRTAR